MEKELLDALEELGLSKNESKIYLTLLEIGPSSCSKISDVSKTHRPNAYEVLDRLAQKGLVKYINRGQTKYFEAAEPQAFKHMIQQKTSVVESILPRLEILKTLRKKSAQVSVHEGTNALRNLLHQMLEKGKPLSISGVPQKESEYLKEVLEAFHERRISKRILMKHIYHEEAKERIEELNNREHTKARYVPGKVKTQVSTIACEDEVVHVLWNNNPLVAIRITNKDLAQAQQNTFDLLWDRAETKSLDRWMNE